MMRSWRKWTGLAWRVLAALCALLATGLAACSWFEPSIGGRNAYGVPTVPPVPLTVRSFGYQPPGPIHVGDTLLFSVQVPDGDIREVYALAHQTGDMKMFVRLHDDGVAPDIAAGDRVYAGEVQWQASYGTGRMDMMGNAVGTMDSQEAYGSMAGPPLDVLP
jgi:hypothetical protein